LSRLEVAAGYTGAAGKARPPVFPPFVLAPPPSVSFRLAFYRCPPLSFHRRLPSPPFTTRGGLHGAPYACMLPAMQHNNLSD